MKPAAEMRIMGLAIALLALAVVSCRKPAAPATPWAMEQSAETNGFHATLRLRTLALTPGGQLDCELDVQTPAATRVELPPWRPPGLELVNFTALPTRLADAENEWRQFRWTFQAGPPGAVTNQTVRVNCISAQATNSLNIALPAIVIQSAFAPGTFTNALPPLEETNAF